MTRVMAFGTFDVVHKGHAFYLEQAKKLGNELIAVIARDANVLKERGKLPLYNELQRKKDIEALAIADKVVLGIEANRLEIIEMYKPDVICLGYDQNSLAVEKYIKEKNISIKIVRIQSYMPEKYKSSKLK